MPYAHNEAHLLRLPLLACSSNFSKSNIYKKPERYHSPCSSWKNSWLPYLAFPIEIFTRSKFEKPERCHGSCSSWKNSWLAYLTFTTDIFTTSKIKESLCCHWSSSSRKNSWPDEYTKCGEDGFVPKPFKEDDLIFKHTHKVFFNSSTSSF